MNDNVSYYDTANGNYTRKSGADFKYYVSKSALGINVEIGEVRYWKHWLLESYVGIGCRIRTVTLSISDSVQDGLYHHRESIIDHFTNRSATNAISPSISLGIRVGYFFKRKEKIAKQ